MILTIEQAISHLQQGQVLLHATEGVWGFAARADRKEAAFAIADLKGRDMNKGFLVLCRSLTDVEPWLQPLGTEDSNWLTSLWPSHTTVLLPKNEHCPKHLCAEHDSLAVRVTDHPQIHQLLAGVKIPLLSTSANRSGENTLCDMPTCLEHFPEVAILPGETTRPNKASRIVDAKSRQIIRP